MNSYFNAADWWVIVLYLGGIILLGVWFGKDQKNTRDYFLGSKNIPWWGIGLSIVAAETSALTIIGVPAMAYGTDMAFLQMIVGYVIARIILAIIMVPHYFKGEIYSPYQLFSNAFGPSVRQMAGGFFLLSETLAAGVRVYVACIPIKLMLGDKVLGFLTGDPILGAILLFVLLSLLYTYIGGVKAVIWTDAVQFGLFLAGGLFTLFYIPGFFNGGMGEVFHTAATNGKLHWLNGAFTLGAPINIWMGILGGTVMVMSSHGAEQLIVQRVLACKNVRDGRKALALSAVIIFPLFLIFLLCGAMLWVFYQKYQLQIPLPESGPGIPANDFVFPIFMMTEVPHVLKGFLIVAILSAAMSSVSSALTSLASVSTMDFVKALSTKARSEEFYLRFSKTSTVGWAVVLILIAYISRQVEFVLNASFALRGLTSGALLGGLLLAIFWKKGRATPILVGMTASLLVMTGIQVLPKFDYFRTPQFYAEDIVKLEAFAMELKQPVAQSGIAQYLNQQLTASTRNSLSNYDGGTNAELQTALLADLNRIIQSELIYDVQRFASVKLSEETSKLVGKPLRGKKLVGLNRILLLETYPGMLVVHVPEIFWPWYALIGTTVMLVVSFAVRALLPAALTDDRQAAEPVEASAKLR
ncbi:MAG: Na+/solute symporter [Pedosphaera sp.]|nr:Na+/solute symporter [Pedosphaera sp.]